MEDNIRCSILINPTAESKAIDAENMMMWRQKMSVFDKLQREREIFIKLVRIGAVYSP